nr:uncharacterized protein LOC119167481 [Rhipicephalus microplus]
MQAGVSGGRRVTAATEHTAPRSTRSDANHNGVSLDATARYRRIRGRRDSRGTSGERASGSSPGAKRAVPRHLHNRLCRAPPRLLHVEPDVVVLARVLRRRNFGSGQRAQASRRLRLRAGQRERRQLRRRPRRPVGALPVARRGKNCSLEEGNQQDNPRALIERGFLMATVAAGTMRMKLKRDPVLGKFRLRRVKVTQTEIEDVVFGNSTMTWRKKKLNTKSPEFQWRVRDMLAAWVRYYFERMTFKDVFNKALTTLSP